MAKERIGYVGKDKEGFWFARVTITTPNGKRKNIVRRAKNRAEAKSKLKELSRRKESPTQELLNVSKVTFGELADFYEATFVVLPKYVNERKVSGLRDTKHVKAFLRTFRNHFGNRKVREITYAELVDFRRKRLKTPTRNRGERSITTVNRELSSLRRIFNVAIQQAWMVKNPFSCGEPLIQVSAERKRERILTLEEEKRLLQACETKARKHLRPFLIALLTTGCRKSELTLLKWKDVDMTTRLITIQALNTKTCRKRQVAIAESLFAELQSLWGKSDKNQESLVFGIKDNVRKSFSSACREAGIVEGGIEGFTLHACRHTVASRLVKGNMPIHLVGRLLGHTQPQTTYRYLSTNDETLYQAASILQNFHR